MCNRISFVPTGQAAHPVLRMVRVAAVMVLAASADFC
jgi:hypothetical protein